MSESLPETRQRRSRTIFLLGISAALVAVLVFVALSLADIFGTEGDLTDRQQTLNPLIYQQATLTAQWAEARQTEYYGTVTAESAMTQSAATFAAPTAIPDTPGTAVEDSTVTRSPGDAPDA